MDDQLQGVEVEVTVSRRRHPLVQRLVTALLPALALGALAGAVSHAAGAVLFVLALLATMAKPQPRKSSD